MEYFRWVLIAIGLLILIAIVLFANPDRKQSMTRSNKKDKKSAPQQQRQEPVVDLDEAIGDEAIGDEAIGDEAIRDEAIRDEDIYLQRQQMIAGLSPPDSTEAEKPDAEERQAQQQFPDQQIRQGGTINQTGTNQTAAAAGSNASHKHEGSSGIEALFKNNVFSLYIVAERRAPIAGVELLNAALKIGLDFGDHGIFHRLHGETGEAIFSMANLTAPGSFDPTAWNLFETRGVSLFMPLPGPLGAMNGWDTMLASAERLASLLSARIVNAHHEILSRQQVGQIREQMRQIDRRHNRAG